VTPLALSLVVAFLLSTALAAVVAGPSTQQLIDLKQLDRDRVLKAPVEPARSASLLQQAGVLRDPELSSIRKSFADYLTWMTTSKNFTDEMNMENNHGTGRPNARRSRLLRKTRFA
jgi:hypothetical protein